MRKRVFGKSLGRDTKARRALRRSLVRALLLNGEIRTTAARGKLVAREIDKAMTLARKGDLSARRLTLARFGNDKEVTALLFSKYKNLAQEKKSGFVKMERLGLQAGDGAQKVRVSLKTDENIPTKTEGN